MTFTREELLAEKARRQALKQQGGFNPSDLNPFVLGLAQGAGDVGASIGNLFLNSPNPTASLMGVNPEEYGHDTRPQYNIPHPSLEKYVSPDLYSQIGFHAGQFVPNVVGGAGAFRALSPLSKIGKSEYLGNILRAALGEAAVGEHVPGGRVTAGALGAAFPALHGITNKSIGNKIVRDYKDVGKDFEKGYSEFFDKLSKKGGGSLSTKISEKELKHFKKSALPEEKIENYINNPTPENAHYLQSALGKVERKLNKKRKSTQGLQGADYKILETTKDLKKRLKDELFEIMTEKGGLDLPFEYLNLGKKYKKEFVPYSNRAAIRNAALESTEEGAINPALLPYELTQKNAYPFMASMGSKYPELYINRTLTSPYTLLVGALKKASRAAK